MTTYKFYQQCDDNPAAKGSVQPAGNALDKALRVKVRAAWWT